MTYLASVLSRLDFTSAPNESELLALTLALSRRSMQLTNCNNFRKLKPVFPLFVSPVIKCKRCRRFGQKYSFHRVSLSNIYSRRTPLASTGEKHSLTFKQSSSQTIRSAYGSFSSTFFIFQFLFHVRFKSLKKLLLRWFQFTVARKT